jgi:hypothetical protein
LPQPSQDAKAISHKPFYPKKKSFIEDSINNPESDLKRKGVSSSFKNSRFTEPSIYNLDTQKKHGEPVGSKTFSAVVSSETEISDSEIDPLIRAPFVEKHIIENLSVNPFDTSNEIVFSALLN